jgi:hypothetical protein
MISNAAREHVKLYLPASLQPSALALVHRASEVRRPIFVGDSVERQAAEALKNVGVFRQTGPDAPLTQYELEEVYR